LRHGLRTSPSIWSLLGSFVLLLVASGAQAEPVAALYLGYAGTGDNEYYADGEPLPPAITCLSSCSDASSPVGGVRIGYWFERFPWVGAVTDFSTFITGWGVQSPFEIESYPLSFMAMARGRLIKQDGYPNGRVQPYVALGPSIYISTATVGSGYAALGTSSRASDTSVAIGADARVGVEILTTHWFGILLEYRYTYSNPTWNVEDTEFQTELSTSHFIVGIQAHF
jgi:opacity protein-like surface antigen